MNQSLNDQIQKLNQVIETAEKIIRQTRKVSQGDTHIPDRTVSLHDPDARPIQKGKLGVKTEFGYKLEITENEERVVTDYQVHTGNPNDETLLSEAINRHIKTTGIIPQSVATDRGFSSRQSEEKLASIGVKRISIPKRGKKSKERTEHEKCRWFKQLQRWRAGGEGTISVLKRSYGLSKSLSRGRSGREQLGGVRHLNLQFKAVGGAKIRNKGKTEEPPLCS